MSKKIMITGAGGGFGLGTALGLARADHKVIATVETWAQVRSVREIATREKLNIEVLKLDVTDAIDRNHAAKLEVDILVLNAGIMESGAMVDIPMERVRASFEVNVFAHLELVQAFAPQMVARKSGKIVWISSMAGILTLPYLGTYCATKHAIEAIAWAMKGELEPFGIKVATINPGAFRTGFNDTGVRSFEQWYDPKKALLPVPNFDEALAQQYDPQIMIDAMIEAIAADNHLYRTMKTNDTIEMAKQFEASVWKATV